MDDEGIYPSNAILGLYNSKLSEIIEAYAPDMNGDEMDVIDKLIGDTASRDVHLIIQRMRGTPTHTPTPHVDTLIEISRHMDDIYMWLCDLKDFHLFQCITRNRK